MMNLSPVIPFGWPILVVDSSGSLLTVGASSLADSPCDLRITLAVEMPDTRVVIVESADGSEELGRFDLRYGCVFQMFAIRLSAASSSRIAREGVKLRVSSGAPVVIFAATADSDLPPEFAPHLLASEGPASAESVLPRLASPASLQPFNWLHGCVVDALADADDQPALAAHLGRWFLPGGQLRYIGPHSEPRADELFGLEPVLMFAALVRHDPQHPAFGVLRRWLEKHTEADGLLIDRGLDAEGIPSAVTWISIEAIYTVAYPLALAATILNEPGWRDLAWAQVTHRCRHLVEGGTICQRAPLGGGGEQPHWARANAWFLLGLAKTLRALAPHHTVSLAEGLPMLREHAGRIIAAQRADGLWSVYLDDPAAGSDTSASAGLAAALAIGFGEGWLGADALVAARRADAALAKMLTPDGFLGGVAQLNRGGDDLQRGGYRVLGQFALGLYGQLRVALSSLSTP
ncbi:glycoside hydrolase family 88 protein [bacterium]|nr:glycoside hydrolase family 88 protein [bacterium]